MFPAETLVVSPAVHARVRVLGHPELERMIEVPRDAPGHWVITAYLLSIGVDEGGGDPEPEPQFWVEPWNERVRVVEVAGFPHVLEITTWYARVPEAGEQRVCILDDEGGGPARRIGPEAASAWWTDSPPFRIDRVNQELARMFGVVVPRFADHGAERYGMPVERLLADLSPVRRLSLQAHLDDIGLEESVVVRDDLVAATEGIRALLDRFGPDGVGQDATTGWLPRGMLQRTVRELNWTVRDGSLLPDPEDALVALARRMRLIRRLRGDVVLTNRGHELAREPERCRRELRDVLAGAGRERSWMEPTTDVALVLLAIADGTIASMDDVSEALARGRGARGRHPEDGDVEGIVSTRSVPAPAVSESVRDLIGVLAALSPVGGYGAFSPAVRALARSALRGPSHRGGR